MAQNWKPTYPEGACYDAISMLFMRYADTNAVVNRLIFMFKG